MSGKIKKIFCSKCSTLLYKYYKAREGHLVKCFLDNILEDNTAGDLICPVCGEKFARNTMIYGRPANKLIQGKVYIRH